MHVIHVRHPSAEATIKPIAPPSSWECTRPNWRRHLKADVERLDGQQNVERHLHQRRSDAHARHEGRTPRPVDPQSRQIDIPAKRVGDQVNRMTQIHQRPDAMVFAEGCAPGLEERLRRNHEDTHTPRSSGPVHADHDGKTRSFYFSLVCYMKASRCRAATGRCPSRAV